MNRSPYQPQRTPGCRKRCAEMNRSPYQPRQTPKVPVVKLKRSGYPTRRTPSGDTIN